MKYSDAVDISASHFDDSYRTLLFISVTFRETAR